MSSPAAPADAAGAHPSTDAALASIPPGAAPSNPRHLPQIAPLAPEPLPTALPSFLAHAGPLPVTVDAPAHIEGGWPEPEHIGVMTGRCRLSAPPQGWRREDIVGAVLKVTFEDWRGGMPLASSRQCGDYRRLTSGPGGQGEATETVYQRDETECLSGEAHAATLAIGGQRATGAAPRLSSLQIQGIVTDRTQSTPTADGALCQETWQTRRLLRREYHAGNFELCIALNTESLDRLRDEGEAVFFTGADEPSYPLALRRATLAVTYGQRRPTDPGESADTAIMGGLASMGGRWRLIDDKSET